MQECPDKIVYKHVTKAMQMLTKYDDIHPLTNFMSSCSGVLTDVLGLFRSAILSCNCPGLALLVRIGEDWRRKGGRGERGRERSKEGKGV